MLSVEASLRYGPPGRLPPIATGVVAICMILAGASSCYAQNAKDNNVALYRWKEVRDSFQKAGRLIGEERLEEAQEILLSVKQVSQKGYTLRADMHLLRLHSAMHAQDSDPKSPFYSPNARCERLVNACYKLEAYEAAIRWAKKMSQANSSQAKRVAGVVGRCLHDMDKIEPALETYRALLKSASVVDVERRIEQTMQLRRQREEKTKDLDSIIEVARKDYSEGYNHRLFRALELLESALPMVKTNKERQRLYRHICQCLYFAGDEEGRTAWENRLLKETKGDVEIAAAVAIERAQRAYHAKRYDDALRRYRDICKRFPASSQYGAAQFNVGVILKEQKKYDRAIAEYHVLIDSQVNDRDPGSNIMVAFRNYRHRAAVGVSNCYLQQRRYEKALEYAYLARDKHRYQSWCGTCLEDSRMSLQYHIETCLLHLGRHTKVVQMTLRDLKQSCPGVERAARLIALYESAGQVKDLVRMVEAADAATLAIYEEKGYYEDLPPEEVREIMPTYRLRELLAIRDLGQRRDYDALIVICESPASATDDFSPAWDLWPVVAAGNALACGGDEAAAAIINHIQATEEGTGAPVWLVYALGKNPSPKTLPWLEAHAWKRTNWFAASCAVHAISYKGEPGRRIIEQMARNGEGNLKTAAERLLASLPDAAAKPDKWSNPEPWSLPKRLPQ